MGLTVCPAAVVAAPVEVIWENLTQWERYAEWFDRSLQVERSEPEGPATVGQTISFAGKAVGRTWHFIFKVEAVNPERHQLGLHAFFPLGLQMKPHISCTPIDATSCRVQYG
jgi:Polyketide cyclase / dehydrase and lipid transport